MESGATSTSRTSRKCGSHQSHTRTTLAQASTAWNSNIIFQLINMINQNKLPGPDCRRVQAAEKGGTDSAAIEEENQESLNLQSSVPSVPDPTRLVLYLLASLQECMSFNTLPFHRQYSLPFHLLPPQKMSPWSPDQQGHSLELRNCSELGHSPLQLARAALEP